MKTAFILAFILLLLSFHSNAQQTIDKLNVNQLKLPKESTNKALILDGAGQVKSSSTITDTELGYLEGLSDTLVNLLSGKANDSDVVKLSGNQSVDGVKTFTGKLVASSTVNGSIPCPVMTEAQRDLFTPVEGDCVYNSDTLKLNVFDGSVWKDVGGAGGISLWLTANPYNVNDIVIESDKIYRCLIAHTSGTFATDLAAAKWGEVSASPVTPYSLANGGTNKALTAVNGGIVWVDADSFEVLSAGVLGQVLQSNGADAPSWVNKSVSAKSENGLSVTAEELQVSNNQLTQVDTNKHLIESGNNNLLINPSFEHSTFSTGWTNSVGTFTEETVVEIHGKKAAKLVLSSQTMSLTQSSTLYQAQFADGVQGLASVRVKSDVALKICAVQAGVVSTSLCVDVQANNKWGLYKVPFILGATSNGISIASTGTVTGTVYIDDAFVGAVDLSATQSFDTTCDTIACQTVFSSKISAAGVVSDESINWINANAALSGTNNNRKTITFNTSIFTVAPNCTIGSVSCVPESTNCGRHVTIGTISSTTLVLAGFDNQNTGYFANDVNIICQKQGADYTAALQAQKDFEKSKVSSYSSTNADTDWQSCTPGSIQGFASPTYNIQCKRDGSDLLMKGRFSFTTVSAVEARLGLPVWNGVQLISAGTSKISSLEVANGFYVRSTASSEKGGSILIAPSISYFAFGSAFTFSGSSVTSFGTSLATTVSAGNENISFNARIPIEGWQNSNIIIGQFNGLESCSSTLDCTDTFSARVSGAGAVSNENIDWINGNCSVNGTTGEITCPFRSGVFTEATGPNCQVTPIMGQGVNGVMATIQGLTSSSIIFKSNRHDAIIIIDNVILTCQKQGVDYVGKTAKAVASDQNVRNPGVTNAISFSFAFGTGSVATACTSSPCSALDQSGSMVSSVTRTGTGDYVLNFNQTINKLACTAKQISGAAGSINFGSWCSNCTSATLGFRNTSGGAQDASASVVCVGNL